MLEPLLILPTHRGADGHTHAGKREGCERCAEDKAKREERQHE